MWTCSLKCSLVVLLFACAFFASSDSVSAGAYDGAGATALSNAGAFEDAENIPGAHDRHKGIRSYDSTGFPHDNNANRGVKSYGTPSGHGASHDHGIKGGDHGYNKNDDGCSKCKWENDDYWERDEPEEEGDENDGDECDDGQYRPHKAHHRGPGRGHIGSHPSGVHKTGPTGVYVDDGHPSGPLGGINYPTSTEYSRPISGYESTPKPGSDWNTPFADASKPGYGSVTASTFGTTPSPWSDWNRGTTPGSGSPPKPAWTEHDGRFPSSQGPGAPVSNFGATSKPGQGWNTNQFPSGSQISSSSAIPHTGSGIPFPSIYGNPQNQNKPYGQPETQGTYAGAYAGASVTSGIGSPGEASNFGRKDGLYKPINTQTLQGSYSGTNQVSSNIDSGYYGLGDHNKPGPGSYSTPTTVTSTFGTTKEPHKGITSSRTIPGAQTNPFFPGKSPGSLTGSNVYEHPGVTKPSYGGSTTAWLGAGQTGSGSSTWPGTATTPGFPTLNTGFGTTKTPFSHVSIPSSTLSVPYDRTGAKQPNFNVASSSATAGASVFGTSPNTYSTPSIAGSTSLYGTTPVYRGDSSYTPGVKSSVGSTRPTYETVPHPNIGTHPNIESGIWPERQPGSNIGSWSVSGKPEDGSGITPGRHSPGISGILPGKQPQDGRGTWPSKKPGDGSGTWPSQVQPGHGSGPGCGPSGNCGGAIGPQGGSCGGCCGNYNCDSGCSGRDNVPAHGLCGGATGPSEVNKTYYPAGTGDGNVPNIGTIYGPDSHLNTGAGIRPVYPGTQGASVTSESPVSWNAANPFLYGNGGTPSSVSHPWTPTTDKPIGPGNPFLDSSWNSPKPGYSNYNDRNVIPQEENTKPIGQGNLFLNNKNRGNIGDNSNKGVIPLGEKIPEGNNPFLTPLIGGSGGSGSPLHGKYPDKSETPGNYPGSGTPGNYPGSGTPGNYPGSGTPGNYPGSRAPGSGSYGAVKGGVKGGFHSGGAFPQDGNSDRSYPQPGGNPQGTGPLQCKLGLFGCGTPGSGSYAGDKHQGGGNVGTGIGNPGSVGNIPGGPGNPGISPGYFAGHLGSGGNNLATSGGGQARAYAGAFSSAQASSSNFADSFSGAPGPASNFGGNLSPNEAQNQGGLNSWASSGASAFASSSAGSWSGNRPIDVKG